MDRWMDEWIDGWMDGWMDRWRMDGYCIYSLCWFLGDEALVISTALSRSMFSGQSGFREVYRTELQQHLKVDPMFQDIYDAGTADLSRFHAPAIIADYPPFGSCKHICDIGGGLGTFLHAILEYYGFGINGTNFDLPDVIENSRYVLISERIIYF